MRTQIRNLSAGVGRRTTAVILPLLVALLAFPSIAGAGPYRVTWNPSSQMTNTGAYRGYVEGKAMYDLARRAKRISRKYHLKTAVAWAGKRYEQTDPRRLGYESMRARRLRSRFLVAMHSDSVGNVRRGILVLYRTRAGRRLGAKVGRYIARKMHLPWNGMQYRPGIKMLRSVPGTAILIEYLNHSRRSQAKALSSRRYREKLATVTVQAVYVYGFHGKIPKPKPGTGTAGTTGGAVGIQNTTAPSVIEAPETTVGGNEPAE